MPFQITINGTAITLGSSLPTTITSFSVTAFPGVQIPSSQTPLAKQWLNTIIDHLDCEYVTYNGTLIPSSDLTKFTL